MLALPSSSGPRAPDPTKPEPAALRQDGQPALGERARSAAFGRKHQTKRPGGSRTQFWEERTRLPRRALWPPIHGLRASSKGGSAADHERIRSFTEKTRGRSLYEEHQAKEKSSRDARRARCRGR